MRRRSSNWSVRLDGTAAGPSTGPRSPKWSNSQKPKKRREALSPAPACKIFSLLLALAVTRAFPTAATAAVTAAAAPAAAVTAAATTPAAAAAATVTAATTTALNEGAGRALFARPGDVDRERTALELVAVEFLDTFLGLVAVGHCDKGKSAGAAGELVEDDFYDTDGADLAEQGFKILGSGGEGKIPDV